MNAAALTFAAPGLVEVRPIAMPTPGPGEVVLRIEVSAISAGTEMLAYRGELPADLALDATIPGMGEPPRYPMQYGYAAVGRVTELGPGVGADWRDTPAFVFAPHQTHVVVAVDSLLPIGELDPEAAALLPSMETAVSLAMDGAPVVGETVAIFGQGVVGLLLTAILGRIPGLHLVTVDRHERRRRLSLAWGATESLEAGDLAGLASSLSRHAAKADLTYELSGHPDALNHAIGATGFGGRLVVGSWYGDKPVMVELGGSFHRDHMRLISSQVSALAPRWGARWTKLRRWRLALDLLSRVDVGALVSHRFALDEAPRAYAMLDQRPGEALQVVLTYPG